MQKLHYIIYIPPYYIKLKYFMIQTTSKGTTKVPFPKCPFFGGSTVFVFNNIFYENLQFWGAPYQKVGGAQAPLASPGSLPL